MQEEIRLKKTAEQARLSDSLKMLGDSVQPFTGSQDELIRMILERMGQEEAAHVAQGRDFTEKLVRSIERQGIVASKVRLRENWWRSAISVMLCMDKDDNPVLLLPAGISHYNYADVKTGRYKRVKKAFARSLQETAWCFYYPLPAEKLSMQDVLQFSLQKNCRAEALIISAASVLVTLLSLILPRATQELLTDVLDTNGISHLMLSGCILLGITVVSTLLGLTGSVSLSRLRVKITAPLEAAIYNRVLRMPPSFFKKSTAGEISNRMRVLTETCASFINTCLTGGIAAVLSVLYLIQMLSLQSTLAIPALAVMLGSAGIYLAVAKIQRDVNLRRMRASAKVDSLTFELYEGIRQIRRSGAENAAFTKWAQAFAEQAHLTYAPPKLLMSYGALVGGITLLGTAAIYALSICNNISAAAYYGFSTSYGLLSGSLMSVTRSVLVFASLRPAMEMARPILETVPETGVGKINVDKITGDIDVSHISYRYEENAPTVLDDISLHIAAGSSVAVVGETGCGKSTLLRILLGLETPATGSVYYDKRDIRQLELSSLRGKIGAVLQSSELFLGDIYSNITIAMAVPEEKAAWEAAELAGIADDIRAMPMGMHTAVSEGGGGLSTGQKQRILLARALAHRPKVLFLDEATSAMDNLVQKRVMASIHTLQCTTVMIAHRLSTIRQCDRILVMQQGKIVADGTYDALLEGCPFFRELVQKQSVL